MIAPGQPHKSGRTWMIDGVAKREVRELRVGDRVDLEGDVIADPESENTVSPFAFEFEVVHSIVVETPDCTLIVF